MSGKNSIIVENKLMTLKISEDCIAESLILKATGEECLEVGEEIAMFSVTEDRPFNNEIKLAHPNKRTTFQANRIRREGNRLIVGFELVTFEAVIEVKEADDYIAFTLVDFNLVPDDLVQLAMDPPPVAEFRLIQLPVKKRERFGEWLNVMWDDKAAVNVLANSPFAKIDSEKRKDCRIMYADALRGIKLKGCSAALIVSKPDQLLDCIETLEVDYDLPRGVESRRARESINASIYWVYSISPANVDAHIARAKQAGMRYMLIYYRAIGKTCYGYGYCGNYGDDDFNDGYPNGFADLKAMLEKIKAAGITPGIHFLHTHIGVESKYVTPVADHRLNLTRYFTLAKPLSETDDVIYVEQNPEAAVMHPKCRVLKFGGELISYENYSTEYPYCFKGCKRGAYNTNVINHPLGEIGGILDLSEFGASSLYLDQTTSLQDEIALALKRVYDSGFEFIYYDGSEGTNPPFEIYVPYAQYRVYKVLDKAPLFCEGAAKAHFSWHMLSGGNAFDTFPTNVFKKKIAQYPLEEASRMANDFTRLNFGWWAYRLDTQPDIYEYGTSKAASWDCPGTMQTNLDAMKQNARTDDILEVLRRWEDVRLKNWITDEQKEALRDPDSEYTLLINENGEYELVPYYQIENAAKGSENITAFVFERCGRSYVVCWHKTGEAKLALKLDASDVKYEADLGKEAIAVEASANGIVIPVAGKRYLSTSLSKEALIAAFENAELID